MKLKFVLTDAVNQMLLQSVSATHYHLQWKDGMKNVLDYCHEEVYREQCHRKYFRLFEYSHFFSQGIKSKSLRDKYIYIGPRDAVLGVHYFMWLELSMLFHLLILVSGPSYSFDNINVMDEKNKVTFLQI